MTPAPADAVAVGAGQAPPPSHRSRPLVAALLLLGALAIFWLGYAVGRVQSIADLSHFARDADVDRYAFSRAGTLVHFERLGGDGKPYVRSADGFELLDLSDWDHNARVVVDGAAFELVRLYPTSAVDYGRYRVAQTLAGDGWLLQREISLDSAGMVHIQHAFVARRTIRRVELSIAYVHPYLLGLQVAGGRVTAAVSRQTREQTAAGAQAPPAYRLEIGPDADGPAPLYRVGDIGPLGPSSVIADMTATDPAPQQRVLLGAEIIGVQPVR